MCTIMYHLSTIQRHHLTLIWYALLSLHAAVHVSVQTKFVGGVRAGRGLITYIAIAITICKRQ